MSFQPDLGPASMQRVVDASWMDVALLGALIYHDCSGVDVVLCLELVLEELHRQ